MFNINIMIKSVTDVIQLGVFSPFPQFSHGEKKTLKW